MNLNQQTMHLVVFKIRRGISQLPYTLLIERFTLVRLTLLVIVGAIALYVVVSLLYLDGSPNGASSGERPVVLEVDTIDALEVWVEERQTEREREIIPGQRTYFKS